MIIFTRYKEVNAVITKLDDYFFGSSRNLPISINFSGQSISSAKKTFVEL